MTIYSWFIYEKWRFCNLLHSYVKLPEGNNLEDKVDRVGCPFQRAEIIDSRQLIQACSPEFLHLPTLQINQEHSKT